MIDLHVHSIYSDGTDSPAELVALGERCGITAMALTDHDTVGGLPEFLAAARNSTVEAVPGIELSAECERGTMHVLGYFIDFGCRDLLAKIEKVREGREKRNREILKTLNKLGYVLLWTDVQKHAGRDVIGRPHFAEALVARGHVKTKKAAFDLLLAKGRPGYHERYRYTAGECIDLIRKAGGVPVLAHPSTIYLPDEQFRTLLGELKGQGLAGIEVFCAEHHPENMQKYMTLAKEFDLISTGGTDFHGAMTPDITLGIGYGGLKVPAEALDRLKAAAGR